MSVLDTSAFLPDNCVCLLVSCIYGKNYHGSCGVFHMYRHRRVTVHVKDLLTILVSFVLVNSKCSVQPAGATQRVPTDTTTDIHSKIITVGKEG